MVWPVGEKQRDRKRREMAGRVSPDDSERAEEAWSRWLGGPTTRRGRAYPTKEAFFAGWLAYAEGLAGGRWETKRDEEERQARHQLRIWLANSDPCPCDLTIDAMMVLSSPEGGRRR